MRLLGGWWGSLGRGASGFGVWAVQCAAKKGDARRMASWAAKRRFSGPTRSITIGLVGGSLRWVSGCVYGLVVQKMMWIYPCCGQDLRYVWGFVESSTLLESSSLTDRARA